MVRAILAFEVIVVLQGGLLGPWAVLKDGHLGLGMAGQNTDIGNREWYDRTTFGTRVGTVRRLTSGNRGGAARRTVIWYQRW